MAASERRNVEHEATIHAPADAIYQLISDVTNWPQVFPPSVNVEYLERKAQQERIRIWATANGSAKSWTSRRTLDPVQRRIEFRQEVSAPPVGSMGGTWIIEPISDEQSRVRLLHDYQAAGDDPADLEWITNAVDTNSRSELAALTSTAELAADGDDGSDRMPFSFIDEVFIDGDPKAAFDFINDADRWTERLPHVSRVSMHEDTPGLQILDMDTQAKDGSTHNTRSVRVCFPHQRIVYKQVVLPGLLSLHTGTWRFVSDGDGSRATSQHTVAIKPDNITDYLGADAGVPEAKAFVQSALSQNSMATLERAKAHAEQSQ